LAVNTQTSATPNHVLPTHHSRYPATPIVGPVYYVAPYGSDSHSKAQAANPSTPWRTLQKAADNAVPGDTIVVKDGIYKDSVTTGSFTYNLDIKRSGTPENPIRFVSANKWGAVLDAEYKRKAAINIRSVSHVIIEGFEIRHGTSDGIAENWAPGSSFITIRSNWIHDIANHRQTTGGCDSSDTFHGKSGIYSGQHSRYWIVEKNLIHSNGRLPGGCAEHDYKHDHGWYAQGHGHIAQNNIFFDHLAGWDIKVDLSARNPDGTNFVFPDNERGMVVLNNTFASRKLDVQYSSGGQITLYRNSGNKPKNVLIMNNVFWNSRLGPVRMHLGANPWPGLEIIGNITTNSQTGGEGSALLTGNQGFESHFNCGASCEYRVLKNNIVGANSSDSTLGMKNPKSTHATENDFRLTSSASTLTHQGTSSYTPNRHNLPTVNSPQNDYHNMLRPKDSRPSLGAHEGE
jgi:hypothetical protein